MHVSRFVCCLPLVLALIAPVLGQGRDLRGPLGLQRASSRRATPTPRTWGGGPTRNEHPSATLQGHATA